MENPLESAGEAVKGAGELASDGLFGMARFLEQVTGDAVSASIFAAFLLFSLTLIKGAGLSRNSQVYSKAILNFGVVGIGAYVMYSMVGALSISSVTDELDIIQLGITGQSKGIAANFYEALFSTLKGNFWYGMVFVVMTTVGFITSNVSDIIPKSSNTKKN